MSVEKVRFGVEYLDKALDGGIPKNSLVLVSGGAGTGKSTLCMQYIINGAKNGERGLYISTEQTFEDLNRQAQQYGWNLKKLHDEKKIRVLFIDIISEQLIFRKIREAIEEFEPKRMVIDSLNTLSDFTASNDMARQIFLQRGGSAAAEKLIPENITENLMRRRIMLAFLNELRSIDSTTLLTSELPEKGERLSADGISEFIVDGIIILYFLGIGSAEYRSLQIRKMRYTEHEKGIILYELGTHGFEIVKEKELKF